MAFEFRWSSGSFGVLLALQAVEAKNFTLRGVVAAHRFMGTKRMTTCLWNRRSCEGSDHWADPAVQGFAFERASGVRFKPELSRLLR